MRTIIWYFVLFFICGQCFSAPPPKDCKKGEKDNLRTANEILDIVDKSVHIVTPPPPPHHPQPTPHRHPQPPAHVVIPVIVCAYPENCSVVPVIPPWKVTIEQPVPPPVIILPSTSVPKPLPPAKVPWKR